MTDDSKNLSNAMAKVIGEYTWLVFDFFLFLVLASLLLGYKDFSANMQLLTRGFLVISMWIFFFSGIHITIYIRFYIKHKRNITAVAKDKSLAFWEYFISFGLKGITLILFLIWIFSKGLLS